MHVVFCGLHLRNYGQASCWSAKGHKELGRQAGFKHANTPLYALENKVTLFDCKKTL